jgi:uncharacterized protein involved in exopolysaccharide biosynthesis
MAAPLDLLPVLEKRGPIAPPDAITEMDSAVRSKHVRSSVLVGAAVALTVFTLAAAITWGVLPRSYLSVARVQIERPEAPLSDSVSSYDPFFLQTECAVIRSRAVLEPAMERLNLARRWGPRHGVDRLPAWETIKLLQSSLDLRQTPNTSLIEIRVYDEHGQEAAEIANAIAETYRSVRTSSRIEIIDRAEPSRRPARPDVALNLLIGAVVASILGAGAAGLTYWICSSPRRAPSLQSS